MEPDTIDRIGRFRIVERLGTATARDVFLGEDDAGKRAVLKVLAAPERNQGLLDPALADEASAYAGLSHPNILQVLELFSAEGHFVIALEHVEGASLNVVRAALKRQGGALEDDAVFYIGGCLFSALAAAHGALDATGRPAPVLHRNVNPSNLLIAWDGVVKLGNFNVANVVAVLRESNPGLAWGSYGYQAPEQIRQQPVGPAADVYAACVLLWELLAGRKAIERGVLTDAEVLTAMASPKITPLDIVRADVDQRVRDALRVGLEVDPARRMISAAELRDILTGLVDMDAERARLATMMVGVRPDPGRPRVASRPNITQAAKGAPPRPASKPTLERVASRPEAQPPDPGPVVPAPTSPSPLLELASSKTTLPFGGAAPEPAVAVPPPSVPAPALSPVLSPAPPLEPHPPLHTGNAIALEPAASTRSRPLLAVAISATVLVAAAGAVVIFALPYLHRASAPATAIETPSVPAPPATVAASTAAVSIVTTALPPTTALLPEAPPAASTPAQVAIPADHGEVRFPAFAAGHRIFVDGRVVGDGAQPALVRCGSHSVRIGSSGSLQDVQVPCGGSVTVTSR